MNQPQRIRIVLAAKLRANWSAVVEVPDAASESELDVLVDQFFHKIPTGEFHVDEEYWGRGECEWRSNVDAEELATYRAVRDSQGKLVIEKVTRILWCVVHGEACVPQVFESRVAAEVFKKQCADYVSGPWEIAPNPT